MKLTDIFVRRPVLAIVVNLVILIAGLAAVRSLSVRQFPKSDIAVIKVTTAYVGANADLVRGFITTPLERVIAAMDGTSRPRPRRRSSSSRPRTTSSPRCTSASRRRTSIRTRSPTT
jgi:multidrug efflux pump